MSLTVTIEGNEIYNKHYYNLSTVSSKEEPNLFFKKEEQKCYTFCMIDTKVPKKNSNGKSEWLHWLVINCDKDGKETIAPYEPPTPPKNSGVHKYYICLYEQPRRFYDVHMMEDTEENRFNFNMEFFVAEYQLKCIGYIMFKTSADRN